jgi:transcriptional regulator with XRE-family HTH domain
MTLPDVADELGLQSPSTVGHWERARNGISAMHLHALACCFGVTMDSFFEGVSFDEKDAA